MLARAEQLLGHPHLEQIVEREPILTAAGVQRTHEIALDPVANTFRCDRENSQPFAWKKSRPAARLCRHFTTNDEEYKQSSACSQRGRERFLNTC